MVLAEVIFQRVIVDIVLLLATTLTSVADVAAFMLVPAVCVQFVVSIEAFSAESTLWVSLESTLIDRARVVVPELLMLAQFRECEKFVFVRKDFFVSRAKVATFG
jgi:hypothetical protein